MAEETIVSIISGFALLTSNLGTFLFTKKRFKEDVDKSEIDNLKSIVEIQQSTIVFLQKQIENLQIEINELRKH